MTVQQMERIAELRQLNYPYSFIGRVLDLPVNTVKSVCIRKGIKTNSPRKTKAEKENAAICKNCHKPLNGVVRQGALFCSDYCRTAWRRKNRRIIEKDR